MDNRKGKEFMETNYSFGLILKGKIWAFEQLKEYILVNFEDNELKPVKQATNIGKIWLKKENGRDNI